MNTFNYSTMAWPRGGPTKKKRTTRDIERGAAYFANSRRKGGLVHQRYPVHELEPGAVCPQNALDACIAATADYNGPELSFPLPKPRRR